MTRMEFSTIVQKAFCDIWGIKFDDAKAETWYTILCDLQPGSLVKTLESLLKDPPQDRDGNKITAYPPTLAQVLERHKSLRERGLRAAKAEADMSQAGGNRATDRCLICLDRGHVLYLRGGYEYYCMCLCPMGRDSTQFTPDQLDPGSRYDMPKQSGLRYVISPYIRQADEVLSDIELAEIKACNTRIRDMDIDVAFIKGAVESFIGGQLSEI